MKKLFKIILAIGGAIAGIMAIFSATKQSKSKKEFNKRVKANEDKLDFITKNTNKVKKEAVFYKNPETYDIHYVCTVCYHPWKV